MNYENAEKGKLGEKIVGDYYRKKGYKIERPKNKKGFDFLAKKGRKILKIEAKATENVKGGVPDMNFTEFEEKKGKWFLVADFLCVVRLKTGYIELLPKRLVDSYLHSSIVRIKVSSKLKTDLKNGKKLGKRIKFKI